MGEHGDRFPIVGVGASAGGVEALSRLFELLPAGLEAAFVVITHLSRHRDSLLPEILGRLNAMPMVAAADGQSIEAGHVYLNSPDTILSILDNRFVIVDRSAERNPVDILLNSLAGSAGHRAIAVILSGTGTDGALGVEAVCGAGGLSLAQRFDDDPSGHHGMPEAAVATGFVDAVLLLPELAARLVEYITELNAGPPGAATSEGIAPTWLKAERDELYSVLQARVGHDFSGYKTSTFLRRVQRRMQVRRIAALTAYLALLHAEPAETDLLFRELLIGVTAFFRDPQAYQSLATLVIPHLFDAQRSGDPIRIWVPGCATGEEAYSIAMLLREHIDKLPVRLQIFASDVDEQALSVARTGRYPALMLDGLSPERLARFFVAEGASFVVSKEIREICLFSRHSLIRDPPFSRIDLISCRNVLIYLKTDVQRQVIPLFHYALRSDGFLFLGSSEHASQHADLFEPLDKKQRIFRRCAAPGRPPVLRASHPLDTGHRPRLIEPISARPSGLVTSGQSLVLDKYAPAHIVVDQHWDVIHFSVRTGKYLEAPYGGPSRNLLAMARAGLAPALRAVLHEAAETGTRARRDGIVVQTELGPVPISLTVESVGGDDAGAAWLIVLADTASPCASGDDAAETAISPGRDAAWHLEQELANTRQRLHAVFEESQVSVEELKSNNEEMLSVNEELQSANEELETSKEEMQSLNEELQTVNAELSSKVGELDQTTNDIRNLFESTRIATLFLDDRLIIRAFTPATNDLFKLLPGDRGRSILDFGSVLDYGDLAADVRTTLATAVPLERRLAGRDGSSHYLMRILPYRKASNTIDGVIMTFVDVTSLVELGQQQAMVAELNHRVKNVLAVINSLAVQLARRCTTVQEFSDAFVDRINGLAKTHDILTRNNWKSVGLAELVAEELSAFVADAGRVAVGGPQVQLAPGTVTTLGIIFHELATNAVKYGAFSIEQGRLSVTWSFETRQAAQWVVLVWREIRGPKVAAPKKQGFGMSLIERCLEYGFEGSGEFQYQPSGVVVTLAMPLANLVSR